MSRGLFHAMMNELSGSFLTFYTSFSGNVSLAAPGGDEHLRLYKIELEGPASLANTVAVQINVDGVAQTVKYFDAGKTRTFSLLGRYLKADTSVHFSRPNSDNDQVDVTVYYRHQRNDVTI